MALFKKNNKSEEEEKNVVETTSTVEKEPEKWVWVDGYKGMDKDMQCHGGFQYELGKHYDMPEDATIEVCEGGFHLCMKLEDVFGYVRIGNGNRFFRVRALVRESDLAEYGQRVIYDSSRYFGPRSHVIDKLAAKSIEIVSELNRDEILECSGYRLSDFADKYKDLLISHGYKYTVSMMHINELTEYGYSMPFATWLVDNHKYDIAKVAGSQSDMSMDMKALMIFNFNC